MFERETWRREEKAAFLVKAGVLLEQGYTLHQALQLLSWEQPYKVKEKIMQMIEELLAGTPVHDMLAHHDFPSDVTAYVFFSEQGGGLAEGLIGAGELFRKRLKTWTSIRQLLRYPLILVWAVVMIAVVMVQFLFPSFRELFQSLDIEFPLLTRMMIVIFQYVPYLLFGMVPFVLLGVLYYAIRFRQFAPDKQFALLWKIPFLQSYLQLFLTYYFSLQFSSMLKGGISIYEACQVFEKQHHFPFFQLEGTLLKQKLKEGKPLSAAVENSGWYRKDMKYVIQHGQEAGKLDEDLRFYGERVIDMLETRIKKTVMTLQPSLFLVIGSIILIMFLSVFLPMFQLMSSIQ
ncbi:competence type IV pilus assembly protein ComGB [Salibacterium aidingense]|uniref:competence type IV pilus assembly protein ComGB n=1 Tax=Salibacterium aidingense TaxID=384933 RepID=UPI0003FA1792|nr:competence type IV pilus assembly protein ComGB [Salibacterium aidingense]